MLTTITLKLEVAHDQEGTYFTLPFQMPADTASLTLSYRYERFRETPEGSFVARKEVNIIDLGLLAPDGTQVGASGSDKPEIFVSETRATPGYRPQALVPGEWRILVGAYHVAPEGVTVTYELAFTPKSLRWLKGDLHAHTLASDGVLSAEELGWLAVRSGLDFLAVTDHNQQVSRDALPQIPGLTLLPGVEWTHFKGHATMIGVDRPYDQPFAANSPEETRERFTSARERGALVTIAHPFEPGMDFAFDMNALPFNCLEIWNGPMRESNLKAVGLWQSLLAAGKKIPAVGGSDFHRVTPFIFLGGPTTCVFAQSAGQSDILAALRQGRSYIIFAPDGPSLELRAGEAIIGDSLPWPGTRELEISLDGLLSGDVVRVVTAQNAPPVLQAPSAGRFQAAVPVEGPGFARVEVLRSFLPGIPLLPALISNPIWFEER